MKKVENIPAFHEGRVLNCYYNIYKEVKIIWHSLLENLSSYLLAVAQSEDCSIAPHHYSSVANLA